MPYVEREKGVRIHYNHYGRGFPLVFLHGFSANAWLWAYQAPRMAGFSYGDPNDRENKDKENKEKIHYPQRARDRLPNPSQRHFGHPAPPPCPARA